MSGPRSKRLLLGKGHARKKSSGCPLTALTLMAVPTAVSLGGWAAGATWGWLS